MVTLAAFGAPVERMLGAPLRPLLSLGRHRRGRLQILLYPDSVDPVIGASVPSRRVGAVLMLMR